MGRLFQKRRTRNLSYLLVGFLIAIVGYILTTLIAPHTNSTSPNTNLQSVNETSNEISLDSSEVSYRTSWLGNTFAGGDKWVQLQIQDIAVNRDGTVFTNSKWDEAGREVGIYKDGDVLGKAAELHGWGRNGGDAIATNGQFLYVAMKQSHVAGQSENEYPPEDVTWYCVRRYDLDGTPAPFTDGKGYDGSMLVINESAPVTGLAASDNDLYVSDPANNLIRVFDADSLQEKRSWPANQPSSLALDGNRNVWVIQGATDQQSNQILAYSSSGEPLNSTIDDVVNPTDLAFDPQGHLLVAENGPRQQVLIYDVADTPRLVSTFGEENGVFGGDRGAVAPKKFYGLSGVGSDRNGNLYVSNDGFNQSGTDLRKFSPDGELQWQLLGLQFLDCADVDPATDGTDVYTKDEHFVMDYSQGAGEEWHYASITLDPFRYPDDPRLHSGRFTAPFVRRIAGERFLFLTTQYAEQLAIYRFDGNIAVPSGLWVRKPLSWPEGLPEQSMTLWRDQNGDGAIQTDEYQVIGREDDDTWGWEVDSRGDIWQASEAGLIRHYPFQGLDEHGNPIYDQDSSDEIPMPDIFTELNRIKYFPETDVMYLSGYTHEHPHEGREWGTIGREIVRYDHWSDSRQLRWRTPLPYSTEGNPPDPIYKAMDIAGDLVFAVTVKSAKVSVYDANTGEHVMDILPGSEVHRESGWVDIPYGIRAYQRANDEYLVFVEEDAKAKVLMYRFNRPG